MSDPTNPTGAGDFRGSREEKRQDETIMINAENLSDMVSQAKGADAAPAPAAAELAAAGKSGPNMVYLAIGVAVLLVVVLAFVFSR